MERKEFSRRLAELLPPIHAELIKKQPKELLRGKITFPQVVVLDVLRARKENRMSDLARALGVTKSAVTGITDRLIANRLIRRSRPKSDRRIVMVRLTAKGRKLAKKLMDFKFTIINDLFSAITEKEKAQYLNILRKLHAYIIKKKGNIAHA